VEHLHRGETWPGSIDPQFRAMLAQAHFDP